MAVKGDREVGIEKGVELKMIKSKKKVG